MPVEYTHPTVYSDVTQLHNALAGQISPVDNGLLGHALTGVI
jgi:hypothetical protein